MFIFAVLGLIFVIVKCSVDFITSIKKYSVETIDEKPHKKSA